MTWEIWFTIGIALILIGAVIWAFVGIKKKEDNPVVRLSQYLFVYKIVEGDAKGLPTEFLVNWKLTDLENHLYLLYLNLEEGLDIEEYLHKVWVGYSGWGDIYGKVYRTEGILDVRNILVGTWEIVEGRIGYSKVG